jgi:NADPH2:quinone reductase
MRAAWYETNGPANQVLRLGDMPDPEPSPGEVRVHLAASGVNPSDVKTRAGLRRPMAFPRVIPGSDGAGVIDKVGAGVDPSRLGQRVWIFNAAWERPFGTSATYTCVPDSFAPPLTAGLSFAQGACLGIPVMTAHRCLFADGAIKGLNVLVTGGAGVVGHYAIQLAKWSGAACIATTVSSSEKAAHAKAAGADVIIDYRNEDVAARLEAALGARPIHRVVDVDFGVNLAITSRVIASNGVIASYASMGEDKPALPFYVLATQNAIIRPVLIYTMSAYARRSAVEDIAAWATTGTAQFAISARLPLDEIISAHEVVEDGRKIGHVILDNAPIS